jgi:hypothetical protein
MVVNLKMLKIENYFGLFKTVILCNAVLTLPSPKERVLKSFSFGEGFRMRIVFATYGTTHTTRKFKENPKPHYVMGPWCGLRYFGHVLWLERWF